MQGQDYSFEKTFYMPLPIWASLYFKYSVGKYVSRLK